MLPIMQRVLMLGHEVNEIGRIMTGRMGRKERERGYAWLPNSIGCGCQEGEGHCRQLHSKMIHLAMNERVSGRVSSLGGWHSPC